MFILQNAITKRNIGRAIPTESKAETAARQQSVALRCTVNVVRMEDNVVIGSSSRGDYEREGKNDNATIQA